MSSVKKNFIYNVGYQVLVLVLPLATAPYLSRVLGASGVGTYSYTFSIAYYFVMFSMLGVTNYGQREIARVQDNRELRSRVFWEIWALQIVVTLIVTAVYLFYSTALSANGVISFIWLPYVISAGLDINWLFFGLEEFRITVGRNALVKLFTFCLMFLVVRGPYALESYCLLMASSYLLSVLVLWPFLTHRVVKVTPTPRRVLRHFMPNLALFVPVIAVSLYTVLDKVMLGSLAGMEQAGFFENASKVATMPFTLISALGTVMLPRMSSLLASGKASQGRAYIGASMWLAMAMSFALAFGVAGIAEVLTPVYFGPGFEPCAFLMCVIVADMPFMAWANVLRTQYLIPLGRDREYIASVVAGAVVNIGLNAILIPGTGALGAGISIFAAEATVCGVQAWAVAGELPQTSWLKGSVGFFLCGLVMFAFVRWVGYLMGNSLWTLAVQVLVGAASYVFLSLAWLIVTNDTHFRKYLLPALRGPAGRIRHHGFRNGQ